jgi:hypothetical protein
LKIIAPAGQDPILLQTQSDGGIPGLKNIWSVTRAVRYYIPKVGILKLKTITISSYFLTIYSKYKTEGICTIL